jgi:hypothetical protein
MDVPFLGGRPIREPVFLTKPFSPRELVLRVQSVLRRASDRPQGQRRAAGPLRDSKGRQLRILTRWLRGAGRSDGAKPACWIRPAAWGSHAAETPSPKPAIS